MRTGRCCGRFLYGFRGFKLGCFGVAAAKALSRGVRRHFSNGFPTDFRGMISRRDSTAVYLSRFMKGFERKLGQCSLKFPLQPEQRKSRKTRFILYFHSEDFLFFREIPPKSP